MVKEEVMSDEYDIEPKNFYLRFLGSESVLIAHRSSLGTSLVRPTSQWYTPGVCI